MYDVNRVCRRLCLCIARYDYDNCLFFMLCICNLRLLDKIDEISDANIE